MALCWCTKNTFERRASFPELRPRDWWWSTDLVVSLLHSSGELLAVSHFSDRIVRALHLFDICIWERVFLSISFTTGHGVPCRVGPATEQNPQKTTLVPFKPSENLIYVLRAYFSWVNLASAFRADIFANPGEKGTIVKGSKECKPLDMHE